MKKASVSFPELMLMAGTRVALGVGIGLLLSEKLSREARRSAGFALLGVGALTTIPLAIDLIGNLREAAEE